jgi:uncharacterized protein
MTAVKPLDPPSPVSASERVAELDVLRGIALFGVFLANMTSFAGAYIMATESQLLALPTAGIDEAVSRIVHWLIIDKANTLFAFLFGLGFYLQMERLSARGADFERIYRRRITVLLIAGIAHNFLLWTWDILHLYGLAAFALLAMRNVRNRTLLVTGILLALFGRTVQETVVEFSGLDATLGWLSPFSDVAVLERQYLAESGDYFGLVRNFAEFTWLDYILNGAIAGWFMYALGRFLLGAWVGRQRWLQQARDYLPGFRRVMRVALPVGLICEGMATLLQMNAEDSHWLPDWPHWEFVASTVHLLSVPLLATGYVTAIVVGLHTPRGHKLLAPFAAIGRMALTNYVMQSFFYGFVLFGIGPGLALAGKIGTTIVTGLVVVAYALQVVFSQWWLRRYRFGPLEWCWRVLTYGRMPGSRSAPSAAADGG